MTSATGDHPAALRLQDDPKTNLKHRFAQTFGARILVAEHKAGTRPSVGDLLSPMYTVEEVSDGEQVLEAARRKRPDLILADIMMPRVDGFALLKTLRADESLRDVPVMLLSARAGEDAHVDTLDAGADECLVKPFSARELLARLGALLEATRIRRENEKRFHAFVSATSDVIYRMSPDWSEMRHLQGRNFIADTDDPSPTWLDKYIHPDDQPHVIATIQEAVRTKTIFQLEHRIRRMDGTLGWTFSRAVPLKDGQGNILQWFGTASDVTERKQTEQSLREREEQLRLATDAAEIGLWDVDVITDTLFWPPRVKAMFGISPQVPVSMFDFYSCLHPADRKRTSEAFEAALDPKRRALYDVEYRTVGKEDGLIRWVAAKGRGIFDATGKCLRVIGTAIDITARKLTEERLQQREAWLAGHKEAFQAAVNGAPLEVSLGILIRTAIEQFDGKARCAFYIADPEGETLHHVVGMSAEYAHHIKSFRIGADSLSCGLAVHTGQPVLTRDVDAEALWKPWLWLAQQAGFRGCWSFPVETSTGKTVGSFAVYFTEPREATAQDQEFAAALTQAAAIIISRHQETEERARVATALEQQRQELQTADRQKDEFLAMLGHELRNPLAPIANASELLLRTVGTDTRAAQAAVGMIKRQVAQLTRLVDDLLDVSRITQGRIQLNKGPLDLAGVITQAVETVGPQLRDKQQKLSVVASSYEPLCVNGDFARLVQCVSNVLSNAAKYTDVGGEIWVRTRAEDSTAVIEITDTGAGLAPELLPRVFDLFVQGDRTLDRAQGGLGIGLALVKRLMTMHGGEISARSAGLGKGSTFEFRLPRIARSDLAAIKAAQLKTPPRRVLIVDDNVDSANSLSMLLNLQGHEARAVYSAKAALELLQTFQPDIGLLDIGLPEMNGYELAQRLRAMPKLHGIRLIALTGYGQPDDQQRARAAGFDDHLVKPLDLVALEHTFGGEAVRAIETPRSSRK